MQFYSFLVCIALTLAFFSVAYADDSGKSCKYEGEKDPAVLKTLSSEEFRNKLSPFANQFLDAIPSEDYFFKLFDVSFTPSQIQRSYFLGCTYLTVNLGLKCPTKLCERVNANVVSAYQNKKITPIDYFLGFIGTLESSLKHEGKLKPKKPDDTSEKITSIISDIGQHLCSPDVKGPFASLLALNDGVLKFFKSIGPISKKEVKYIPQKFGNLMAEIGKPVLLDFRIIIPG